METKKCNDCGTEREFTAYGKDKRNKDGLQGICLICKKIAANKRKDARRQGVGLVTVEGKTCNECGEYKLIAEFFRDAGFADGHASICKVCKKRNSMAWREANKDKYNKYMRDYRASDKEKFKDIDLRRTYGIGLDTYKAMHDDQNGVCAKCGKPQKGIRPLCVDHDPTTSKETGIRIRALLCYKCNRDQHVLDNKQAFKQSSEYDDKHKKPV